MDFRVRGDRQQYTRRMTVRRVILGTYRRCTFVMYLLLTNLFAGLVLFESTNCLYENSHITNDLTFRRATLTLTHEVHLSGRRLFVVVPPGTSVFSCGWSLVK
jgi:hypothetical protein